MRWQRPEEFDTAVLLESIFDNVSDSIMVLDRDGLIIGANPAVERTTGWSAAEMIGKMKFCEVCGGPGRESDLPCLGCYRSIPNLPSFEMVIRRKDQSPIAVAASSACLPEDPRGALALIFRDVSEQRRKESEQLQRMLTHYVIQAQEEERKRVSRELHDGVGQTLYSILVGLKFIDQLPLDQDILNHLLDLKQMTAQALEEVKNMALELRPSALDDLGLAAAIRSFIKRYETTYGIEGEFRVTGCKRRLGQTVETALYRICQEAMINAAKYADTDKITVALEDRGECVILDIEDQGRGFDPESVQVKGTGLGLFGMRERAGLLGGEVKISSSPGQGAKIRVTIPVDEKGEPCYDHSGIDRR